MDFTIVWADDAQENYRRIALYLLDTFGFDTANTFTDAINSKLQILEKNSFIGRRFDALPAVRKFPLQPYNMIYYAVAGQQVVILNILDSRRQSG